jgi:phospholipase C
MKGIEWRVYESFPSVTMLRWLARYVTDDTNIVKVDAKLEKLREDIAERGLAAVTFVEPAMHHSPETDDHSPFADMYRGQLFLKGIYDILSADAALWRETMLVITYDEHGGFYDHVIPPVADVRERPLVVIDPEAGGGAEQVTSATLLTNYGLRVPTFVVSPWVPAGKGPDIVLDFCSILKTIVTRFCGQDRPFVSDRVDASLSLEAYLSEVEPRMNVPKSPDLLPLDDEARVVRPTIDTRPISRREMQSGNVDYHELTGMLARLLGRDSRTSRHATRR